MTRSTTLSFGLGLPAALLIIPFLLFPTGAAWGDHHEQDQQKQETQERTKARVLDLAQELADLLERGVKLYETAGPQDTVLQQRQRDGAKAALLGARDAAREFVETL